ncbi:hypothetical protein GCM10010448_04500 [Streptomyces glomeratus]|uniref:Secreted protein n=1 Tax=Streptomyces glomeratus TaxID=284452 RepID=A0ABN3YCW1_9ACTN
MRTSGAITRCICSVVAIRYCVSTASASRSPPPASTSVIVGPPLSYGRRRPARRRVYRLQQQATPTGPPTTKARPRSRGDNTAPDRAGIPADISSDN